MSVTVRRATPADLGPLRENEARPELNLVDEHYQGQENGTLIFAVAVDDDGPLGTAVLDFDSDLAPELRNMWVYQGLAGADQPTLKAMTEHRWPAFPTSRTQLAR